MTYVMEDTAEYNRVLNLYLEKSYSRTDGDRASFRRLWDALNESQRAEVRESMTFTVVAKSGRKYFIRCTGSYSNNVHLRDETGKAVTSFCCYPRNAGYMANILLGQKLAIEADELRWLRTAIISGRRPI